MFRQSTNKYGAIRTTLDGYTFDSKAEANHYTELKLRELAGEISKIRVHPLYLVEVKGRMKETFRYRPDFDYYDRKREDLVVEDVKSPATQKRRDYQIIKRLMRAVLGIEIEEVIVGHYKRPLRNLRRTSVQRIL